ncbi:MAG: nuclear transport factor 2 family protein [Bacteroidales bacterium]|nr:nuclear transport factor 2 family protein [Bacteroidales bacterium]
MKKIILGTAIFFLFANSNKLFSQDPALAYDLGEINKVVNKLYSNLTFKQKETPKLAKLKDIFYRKGLLINNTANDPINYTLKEFTDVINGQVRTGKVEAFKEEELSSKVEFFGKIAQCFSTYESGFILAGRDDYITKRGINSIQLIKVNGKWLIVSVVWNEEDEELKLPEKYLDK